MKEGCLNFMLYAILGLLFSIAWGGLLAFFGQYLWNYVVVSMFGLPEITYWKMFALMILVRLIVPVPINFNKKV